MDHELDHNLNMHDIRLQRSMTIIPFYPFGILEPKIDGAIADKPLDRAKYEKAKSYYYTLMGWDANGVPLPEKVEELEIK